VTKSFRRRVSRYRFFHGNASAWIGEFMQRDRKSWRPVEFAERHGVSLSFVYREIREGRLRARKPTGAITIICDRDEDDWLASMPTIGAPSNASTAESIGSSNNSEAAE
jgi:hypothetical protein